MKQKIALVTGANRGLGLGVAIALAKDGHFVYLGCRNEASGKKAQSEIPSGSQNTAVVSLDVTDSKEIESTFKMVLEKSGRIDVLVNNAGIFPNSSAENELFTATPSEIMRVFQTNTLAAFSLCQYALPIMKKQKFGRIVNVSSGMGQLTDMQGGYPAYRISKTALNAVTRIFAAEVAGLDILINSVCPGWVRTDMGGPNAHRSLEEGVFGIHWAATLPTGGPCGGFFRDGKQIDW